jgi:nicotinate phosphoribosyltransferase
MTRKFRNPRTGEIMDQVEIIQEGRQGALATQTPDEALRLIRSRNLTLDTDLYELTMAAGYCILGKCQRKACFDLYYRQNPDNGAFCVFTGLESVIDYVNNLGLYQDDIEYLRSLGIFSAEGLENLECSVRFTGDIYSVPEGSVVFPNEPLIRVVAPISEAQVLETTLLALVGHQTLIATKAARLCLASRGAPVVDFGARRAHGVQSALLGARAAYIGGCAGTSNVRAGKTLGIPVRGTHAHSWVESFDTEQEAFEGYASSFPENAILLVDTYDTLGGVKAAIEVAKNMEAKGKKLQAIRIDSGDLAYYSKAARNMLDEAGLTEVKILASSDLDEWLIQSLRDQGAKIDVWCVGTRLITSYSTPALGIVYKLMAFEDDHGVMQPKIKISQNPNKVTNPGQKKIVRFYNGDNRMIGDLLMDIDEPIPQDSPVLAHHPMYDYMKKVYRPPFKAEEIMTPIFKDGKQVYYPGGLEETRKRAAEQINRLEPEYKRITNPHIYKVSLSNKLHETKKNLLSAHQDRNRGKDIWD